MNERSERNKVSNYFVRGSTETVWDRKPRSTSDSGILPTHNYVPRLSKTVWDQRVLGLGGGDGREESLTELNERSERKEVSSW